MIRAVIVEDEHLASKRLLNMIQRIDSSIQVVAILESVSESIEWFSQNSMPDLLFLDIHLADGISFSIFDKVQLDCFIIFTTAFDQYAIKAFEVNSIDYLLKPFDEQKLLQSIQKFKKVEARISSKHIQSAISIISDTQKEYKERFVIQIGLKIITVNTFDVAYFYVLGKATYLCNKQGKSYPINYSLEKLEEMLDAKTFFRINRQCIVQFSSIAKINKTSKSRIQLILNPLSEDEVWVSTQKTAQFREWLER